jgi:hypothetical protein
MNLKTVRDFHVNSSLSAQMRLYSTTIPNNNFLLLSDAFMAQVINSLRSLRKGKKNECLLTVRRKAERKTPRELRLLIAAESLGFSAFLHYLGTAK